MWDLVTLLGFLVGGIVMGCFLMRLIRQAQAGTKGMETPITGIRPLDNIGGDEQTTRGSLSSSS